jgi:7,8-dihydropterin-6-yl-methyl-4-(beta-D-ribofuranosyl)aminobenzene 5'-phosphate synthase
VPDASSLQQKPCMKKWQGKVKMAEGNISITIMVDNLSDSGLGTEHGLALLIQANGHLIIFDTGQGTTLMANADAMQINLMRSDFLVLSHGHYDHTGGIPDLLRVNTAIKIFHHPAATVKRYSRHPDKPVKDISMPDTSVAALDNHPRNLLQRVVAPVEIFSGVWVTGEIPRITKFEDVGGPFFLDKEGLFHDSIIDDMALWIETPAGLVIVLGCCHSGLVNTVEYIRKLSGESRVRGIIGGMHLLHASSERLEQTCKKLQEWSPDFVIPCHCTGEAATAFMISRLGERVKTGCAGMTLTL